MPYIMSNEKDQSLSITWHDSAWIPVLNAGNVLDYFSERSNPFYDRQCNNEIIKMQRLSQDHLVNMTGTEYIVLHVQDPILYIIRKQYRHNPQHVTPQVDYYIIAGTVYQAPDLSSVLNCRLMNSVHNLQSAFEEAQSFSRYHPSKGYWWDFNQQDHSGTGRYVRGSGVLLEFYVQWYCGKYKEEKKKKKDEPGSLFQRQRVDLLLGELAKKFPPKFVAPSQPEARVDDNVKVEPKQDVKQEKTTDKQTDNAAKPPPDKKPKLAR